MTKDYEYYRSEFIAEVYDLTTYVVNKASSLSPIEGIALFYLIKLQSFFGTSNFTINSQFKIDEFTADFMIDFKRSGEVKKIVIECDGHDFHEKTKEQVEKDKKRDRHFTAKGFLLLRYSGSELVRQPDVIFKDFIAIVRSKKVI